MKKIILSFVLTLSLTAFASAQDTVAPTPTPTANKTLTCSRTGKGNIVFGICGIRGCPTSITVSKRTTKYNFARTKSSNGALTYATNSQQPTQCTVKISSLKNGFRKTTEVSCATALVGANCVFSS